MKALKPFTTEIRARGQLTIPKKLREMTHMEEDERVQIIPVGDSLIITPRSLELDEARRQIKKMLRKSGLSIEKLLDGLAEERETLNREIHDKKGH